MRKFLFLLWKVATFPFRLLFNIVGLPFRVLARVRVILKTEPEEVPLSDSLLESDGSSKMWEHINALRVNLIRVVIFWGLSCLFVLLYIDDILKFIQIPLNNLTNLGLRISGPGAIFDIIPQVTFTSALIMTMPYTMFEIWLFAAPGLRPTQRKLVLALIPFFLSVSITGLFVAYYLILPASLSVAITLTSQFGIYDWELSGYLSFTAKIMILSSIMVYYPFIVYIYSVLYHKPRIPLRIIALFSFFVAALITPGTMILIDAGLALMLFLIYIPTYLAIKVFYKHPEMTAQNVK